MTDMSNSIQQGPAGEAKGSAADQEISPHFMEGESSLPHSQEFGDFPYLEPAQIILQLSDLFL